MKFYLHGSGKQQQLMTYTTVKDHIVQFVQKTYKNGQDIAISLRNLQKMDLTVERISLGSLRQSLRITVATLTDPHVILHWLWCAY